jgi:hypothetical protein
VKHPAAIAVLGSILLGASSPAPVASLAPNTAAGVLQHIEASWKPLRSYMVPVTIHGSVKVSFLSIPFDMTGTEYFKAPDKVAMRLDNVPSLARGFENTMNSMGTPQSWQQDFDITLSGTQPNHHHMAYVLVGAPKRGGNVKSVTMWVNNSSYAIQQVAFAYQNGAALGLHLIHHNKSPYHLPSGATVEARFPQYSGSATIAYGTYRINVPIADSVFQKQ